MLWVIKGRKRRKINDDMEQAFINRGWQVYQRQIESNIAPLPYDLSNEDDESEQIPIKPLKTSKTGGKGDK